MLPTPLALALTMLPHVIVPVDTFKLVPVAAPIFGVVRVGLVANTKLPEPVSSLITPAN